MTKQETERLAKVEQKVDDLKEDMQEVKDTLNTLVHQLNRQENSFVTKKTARWVVGILITLTALALNFWDKIRQ